MLTSARADEMLSATARVPVLEAEISALHTHINAQIQEHAQVVAQEHAWSRETAQKLTKMKEDNDMLVERCGSLLFDATQLEESRQDLIEEVHEKSERYNNMSRIWKSVRAFHINVDFRLIKMELRLQDAYDELTQLETENTKLRALNEDLMYW